jgi:hypothetical protein
MVSGAHPNAVLNFFANLFPHLNLSGDDPNEPVVKHIRAIEDRETEIGFLYAPFH